MLLPSDNEPALTLSLGQLADFLLYFGAC